MTVVSVAVPVPLYTALDYRLPANSAAPVPGARVRVPIGSRSAVGVVMAVHEGGEAPPTLRPLVEVLDPAALLPAELLALLRWAAGYYQHPIGDVVQAALPATLRRGASSDWAPPLRLSITAAGVEALSRLPARHAAQRAILEALQRDAPPPRSSALARVLEAGWATYLPLPPDIPHSAPPPLTAEQQAAMAAYARAPGVHLLQGITGSGKTEIYLRAAAEALASGAQALILVPEIGLTPQIQARFTERFGDTVVCFHSGMGDGARLSAWQRARNGHARVVIGTRSAIWLPFARLGLMVVDEEHDGSFKQQEGFRYSARDVACYRAARLNCPILLGSATPSLESLHNADSGRYQRLRLAQRVHHSAAPSVEAVDVRGLPLHEGLSPPLLRAIDECLAADGQALLFLNRRGFAPVLLCHTCGWSAPCPSCDAHLTLHRAPLRLICHHCGHQSALPPHCPSCAADTLVPVGQGTERIEAALAHRYPGERVERFDADRSRSPRQLAALLDDLHHARVRLLVGTQVLAKGHDFPRLNLVGIVSADQALFGADFRAIERMGQLVTQVAGRAGRSGQAARVLLQTHVPEHPLLQTLLKDGYEALAQRLLSERADTGLPPFGHLALLRAEAPSLEDAMRFLRAAQARLPATSAVSVLPPTVSGMERRGGRSRAQLLLMSPSRAALHSLLQPWVTQLPRLREARGARWSIDVDPYDLM